ncbi:MAG TPA: CBS domain-containing protein [Actinophytocola sp.]|uniref:CBS domain-containing protein n=1 Tax=Actinophytocola sp. TaxID=1872138 RepID=UPI002DB74404|nr:CBS domain-containing protein [Actinophytocola sp.]HEU5475499.1 CBS domain-containing protein [Actinophytocola sp.]
MQARDIMTSPTSTVRVGTTVAEATALLAAWGFGALPVVDEAERLVGVVTEGELVRSTARTVGEAMTAPAAAVGPDTELVDLTVALLGRGQPCLPVIEADRLVGVVTRADLLRVVARDDAVIARDVWRRLIDYSGHDRWRVEVHGGDVTIACAGGGGFADETDRFVLAALAGAVPGVLRARTVAGKDG